MTQCPVFTYSSINEGSICDASVYIMCYKNRHWFSLLFTCIWSGLHQLCYFAVKGGSTNQ